MITDRQEFADFCMRSLGAPVIEINIADEQIDDRIDEALKLYYDYHGDGSTKEFVVYTITQKDINNRYITVDEDITAVSNILPFDTLINTNNLQYQSYMSDMISSAVKGVVSDGGGLGTLLLRESYINGLNFFFNHEKRIRYNRHTNILNLDCDWSIFPLGMKIVLECYKNVLADFNPDVWNDYFFQRLATAILKRQWGNNIKKYGEFQLPSGNTVQGQQIYDEAIEEIKELKEELFNDYQEPACGWVG